MSGNGSDNVNRYICVCGEVTEDCWVRHEDVMDAKFVEDYIRDLTLTIEVYVVLCVRYVAGQMSLHVPKSVFKKN